MRKKLFPFLLTALSVLALSACNFGGNTNSDGGSVGEPDITTPEIQMPDFGFENDAPQTTENLFTMTVKNGVGTYTVDQSQKIYTITSIGEYDCTGDLLGGQIVVEADPETAGDIVINLNGCTITNDSAAPILIRSADGVDISAKKGTENSIYDLRSFSENTETDEETGTEGGAAIYADADLKIKGSGKLSVVANYNNGIHTKKDLKIQNLTLGVKAVNNALKGNHTITLISGNITAISSGGDAVKTTDTKFKNDGITQRGFVELQGGTVNLYAACNGINAASDVRIQGGTLHIFTDKYSEYSKDVMQNNQGAFYVRMNSSLYNMGYKYSAYFYNEDGTGVWKNLSFYQKVNASSAPGGRPAPGSQTEYYYYKADRPAGYRSVKLYAYTSSQAQGQATNFAAELKSNTTLPTASDTLAVSSISTSNKTISASGWTNFQSTSGNTGLAYSCKGIKAGNTFTMSDGTVSIQAKDDGIHVNFDAVMESTGKQGLGNITVDGGTLSVQSDDDGIHADQDLVVNNGNVSILKSYEGLEANRIYIRNGVVQVVASDDGINANDKGSASPLISISGGSVDVEVPAGDTDTLDSNGKIEISGGFVFVKNGNTNGQSGTGGTFDSDNGVSVTGGTVVSIGCICSEGKPSGSKYDTSRQFSAGEYSIRNAEGTVIASFTLNASYKAYLFWSDAFVAGQTYTVYQGDTAQFTFTK